MTRLSYDAAVSTADTIVRLDPDISARDLIEELRKVQDTVTRSRASTCRRCGHPVAYNAVMNRWEHDGPSRNVGCRVASFDRDGTWDNRYSRNAKATPQDGEAG